MDVLDWFGISWQKSIAILGIALATIVLVRTIRWGMRRFFEQASGTLKVDATRYTFFKNTVSAVIYFLGLAAIIYLIPALKTLAITLFAGAGILVAVLGFAAQQAFSNIVSGIFIVVFRPFRVGDVVKIGEVHYGTVIDITLRHTIIKDYENKRIIIPNAVMSTETIINFNIEDEKICKHVVFGISYDSDVDKAMAIMQDEIMKHPYFIDNRTAEEKEKELPKVRIKVINFGDSSVNIRAWAWAKNHDNALDLHWDVNKSIKERFDREGIEIPFPYRTIVYKKDISKAG